MHLPDISTAFLSLVSNQWEFPSPFKYIHSRCMRSWSPYPVSLRGILLHIYRTTIHQTHPKFFPSTVGTELTPLSPLPILHSPSPRSTLPTHYNPLPRVIKSISIALLHIISHHITYLISQETLTPTCLPNK